MRKQLLSILMVLSFFGVSAQSFSPSDIVIENCQTPQPVDFNLVQILEINWDSESAADFDVSFHQSYLDSTTDVNELSDPTNYLSNTTHSIYVRYRRLSDNSLSYSTIVLVFNPLPDVLSDLTFQLCDNDGVPTDGITFVDLGSVAEGIWSSSTGNPTDITFHETMADAAAGMNAIPFSGYQNITPNFQQVYGRVQDISTGCYVIVVVSVVITSCGETCLPPNIIDVFAEVTTATVFWETSTALGWEVYLTVAGEVPAPGASGVVGSSPYVFSGLTCGTSYDVFVRTICSDGQPGAWSAPFSFNTYCQESGLPVNLFKCSFASQACYDLEENTYLIIGTLDQGIHTVSYYTSLADATNNVNPISNTQNFCAPTPVTEYAIYARLQNTSTSDFEIFTFYLNSSEVIPVDLNLPPLVACDEDNNGSVIFDLTTIGDQIDPQGAYSYFTSAADAATDDNWITAPANYSVNADAGNVTIYIREFVETGCQRLYTLTLQVSSECTETANCLGANSLCNALGVPFANTQNNVSPGNADTGCLGTISNPTWFYIPIATAGDLNLVIDQNTSSDFNQTLLDVDFVAYGPFTDPVTPCSGGIVAANIVACSYSTNWQEQVFIPNAQPGQFYLIMVTNFSNTAGYIRITQPVSGGTSEIDCTGLRMTAFLDSNSNGIKDSGESNFPLGDFTYEVNNDGNVHHVTTATGVHNIYDIDYTMSYDLGFIIDPIYAGNYALTTASYSNISLVPGGGLQEYLFPVTVTSGYDDLSVSIIPNEAPRPGFTYENTIYYSNFGTAPVSGTLSFGSDSVVSIVEISEPGAITIANGFSYEFTNLLPFEVREVTVTMQVPTIPTVSLGQMLTNTADIFPLTGDVSPENNSAQSTQTIEGSYDPNDKMESRGPQILHSDFSTDDYLYYTIRFENTGTASAINVNISDVLDGGLDPATVRMVGASHNYVLDRVDNLLNWNFQHIMLPAAINDAEGAKGFVQFKVKPLPGYAVGDIIENTAAIYFDFNPPIITNTFASTFVQQLDIDENVASAFRVYPNPANDILYVAADSNIKTVMVYDIVGKLVKNVSVNATSISLDVSDLKSGMYLLQINDGATDQITKLIIE